MKRKSLKSSRLELLNDENAIPQNEPTNNRLRVESLSSAAKRETKSNQNNTWATKIQPPMERNGTKLSIKALKTKTRPNSNTKWQQKAQNNNIKLENELKLSDLPWGQRWLAFVDNVSIVGLKYAVDPQASNIHRAVWGLFILAGIGLMVYQIVDRCIYYTTYPKTTNVEYLDEAKVRFPTVTICNENLVAQSRAQYNDSIADFSSLIADIYPPYPDPSFTPNFTGYETLFESLRGYDWRNIWYFWSHIKTRRDWIYSCTFNGANCAEDDIREVVTTMGWCLQFNGPEFNHKSSVIGAYNGLNLIMDTQQFEYLYSNSRGAGFRMLLHSPHTYPYVDFQGFRVSPGQSTSVGVSMNNITLLPDPYGDCKDAENYDDNVCLAACASEYVANECSCRLWFTDVEGFRTCDPQEQYECADPAYFYFVQNYVTDDAIKCDCPNNCKKTNYEASVSSNAISNFAMTTIAKTFFVNETCIDESDASTCSYSPDLNSTVSQLYNDLVDIQVYFTTLTVEDNTEVPRYTILSLFCDVGGAMGLILGSTVLTLAELGEFVAFIIYDVIFFKLSQLHFRLKRRRVQAVEIM